MTEDDARAWMAERWPAEAIDRLNAYESLVRGEAGQQNLVAPSTLDHFWTRHIVDSAQLVAIADARAGQGNWIDIGSGAGLPGIVAAILQRRPVTLVEPRRRRADFLSAAVERLAIAGTNVEQSRIETFRASGNAVLSARAVAALDPLFESASHLADKQTLWLLPKGRSAQSELESAQHRWHGLFHVEQSVTAADSQIVVATGVMLR
ncbi:16S rRNA (guanine(527)-N(7))-methyltransferase RsmG [Sphingomonas qomolangmaensis]|uniref:Ribosomal RNA small subunit methyltransferase G n=1 Tax=Sphingomonas qomolangmaensis TaxID=2918765 RepID=A0ABY5L559_9SPHN|nr:16S rRNA (guanine(527)-N(7))-methyltransferase RsmG [Sphingomonas qomolangmaensis]UUL81927.1 16S rRNA (guanine(527)-N(7))-methyltransferase RsmG [Sphingomonas qomolangmaensis]